MNRERYEEGNRTWHWFGAIVAGASCLGVLVLIPQIQQLGDPHQSTLVRIGVLIFAGGAGIVAIRVGTAAGFAGLEKNQTTITWRNLLAWSLYVLLMVLIATDAGVNVSTVLFGGAVISVILAIFSQSTLSNFFAGLVLLIVRPYRVGDSVYLRSGSFGGAEYEGTVTDVGSLYTNLIGEGQVFRIPNGIVVGSVLAPSYKPIRADVRLDVSAATSLEAFEDRLRERLHLGPSSYITLAPEEYSRANGEARTALRLRIRSDQWLGVQEVVRAIDSAVAAVA